MILYSSKEETLLINGHTFELLQTIAHCFGCLGEKQLALNEQQSISVKKCKSSEHFIIMLHDLEQGSRQASKLIPTNGTSNYGNSLITLENGQLAFKASEHNKNYFWVFLISKVTQGHYPCVLDSVITSCFGWGDGTASEQFVGLANGQLLTYYTSGRNNDLAVEDYLDVHLPYQASLFEMRIMLFFNRFVANRSTIGIIQ